MSDSLPSSDGKTLFVILQRLSPIGGIETLVLRLIPYLLPYGQVVIFGTKKDNNVTLPPGATFIPVDGEAGMVDAVSRYVKNKCRDQDIVLVSLHPWSLVTVFLLRYERALKGLRPIHSFHLVTHSRAMFFSGGSATQRLLRDVFTRAPAGSTYFMNDAARTAHAAHWHQDLDRFPTLRLPLGDPPVARVPEPDRPLRIVSVGRLVGFKAYNRGAPEIMRALLDQGIDAHWDIWGDGEDRALIEQGIDRLGVGDRLRLRGELPYADYDRTVAEADVFVGLGTALLEAARQGVPAICAVDADPLASYGFFNDAPSDSVGDIVAGTPSKPILDVLVDFAAMDVGARRHIAEACQREVAARSVSLPEFADAVVSARSWPLSHDPYARVLALAARTGLKLRDRTIRRLGS